MKFLFAKRENLACINPCHLFAGMHIHMLYEEVRAVQAERDEIDPLEEDEPDRWMKEWRFSICTISQASAALVYVAAIAVIALHDARLASPRWQAAAH
jgi:hypothetical protein